MSSTRKHVLMMAVFAAFATGSLFAKKHDHQLASSNVGLMSDVQQPCGVEQKGCFRFKDGDSEILRDKYEYNWSTAMPDGQHLIRFYRGERLNFVELREFQAVPSGYSRGVTALPDGNVLGYYNGMVYAYNPETGVVADAVGVRR